MRFVRVSGNIVVVRVALSECLHFNTQRNRIASNQFDRQIDSRTCQGGLCDTMVPFQGEIDSNDANYFVYGIKERNANENSCIA